MSVLWERALEAIDEALVDSAVRLATSEARVARLKQAVALERAGRLEEAAEVIRQLHDEQEEEE